MTKAMMIGDIDADMTIASDDEHCDENRANVMCASGKGAAKGSSKSKEVIRFIALQRMNALKKIAKRQENVNNY